MTAILCLTFPNQFYLAATTFGSPTRTINNEERVISTIAVVGDGECGWVGEMAGRRKGGVVMETLIQRWW